MDTLTSGEAAAIHFRSAGIFRGFHGGGGRRPMRVNTQEQFRTREASHRFSPMGGAPRQDIPPAVSR